MVLTAYSSLGGTNYHKGDKVWDGNFMDGDLFKAICERTGKSKQIIALKWGLQRGMSIIPKSVNPERMAENRNLFNFTLTKEEMEQIEALNKDY